VKLCNNSTNNGALVCQQTMSYDNITKEGQMI
jgi:hypothetical protein